MQLMLALSQEVCHEFAATIRYSVDLKEAVTGWIDNARSMWRYCRNPRFDLVWDEIRAPVAFFSRSVGSARDRWRAGNG